ncbi:hypothetical protein BC628DRAFT_669182 [Trametes gibbosa]|nr:hypothetical protein BC628DRAFT_669182 [Trametes gibbosa]
MFTTLITLFLSIFGALRASHLYSGILTLGNGGSWFDGAAVLPLLDSEAAIITGELFGNGTPARIFHWPLPLPLPLPLSLPAPPVILSLPSPPVLLALSAGTLGHPDAYHDLISVLTLAALVGLTILVPIKAILSLRAWVRAAPSVDTIDHVAAVIYVSGSPYKGDMFSAWNDLAGVLDANLSSAMSTSIDIPVAAPSVPPAAARKPRIKKTKDGRPTSIVAVASRDIPAAVLISPPEAPALPSNIGIAAEVEPSNVHADDDSTGWQRWTTQRRRRPPRRLSLSASCLCPSSSRSSSVFSTSSTSTSLFSSGSSASTAATTAPSSRRCSFAVSSSSKPLASLSLPPPHSSRIGTPSIPSRAFQNRFSVLEVFSAEE